MYGGQRSLAFELTTAMLSVEIHKKNVRLVPWQLWTITSVFILCEIVILHAKFVVLSCAYCKREFCVPLTILVKAGSMQITL